MVFATPSRRHDMEASSASMALEREIHLLAVDSPHK